MFLDARAALEVTARRPGMPLPASHEIPFRQIQKLQGEVFHLSPRQTDTLHEVVIRVGGGKGGKESGRGIDERFADTGGNGGDGGAVGGGDGGERLDDPPHGAEQADERGGRGRGGEEWNVLRQTRRPDPRGPPEPSPEAVHRPGPPSSLFARA